MTEKGKHKEANPTGKSIRTERELADDLLLICQYRKERIGWRTIAQNINSQRDYELNFSVYYTQYHDAKSNVQKEAIATKDQLIEAELSEIDWQIEELVKAWKRSIGTKQKIQTKVSGKAKLMDVPDGEEPTDPVTDAFVTEWEENGDPRYMAEITKLRERRAKILGFDAPTEVKQNTSIALNMTSKEVVEELERYKKLVEGANE